MVGVAVAEHDLADPAEARPGGGDRLRHALLPRVEDDDLAVVLDQVDVHDAGQAAAQQPHARRDRLQPRDLHRAPAPVAISSAVRSGASQTGVCPASGIVTTVALATGP